MSSTHYLIVNSICLCHHRSNYPQGRGEYRSSYCYQLLTEPQLVNLFVAGRDTIMALLTFSVYMITEHPDVEQRLRQEIMNIVGPTSKPAYEHMRRMKYMKAFLNGLF